MKDWNIESLLEEYKIDFEKVVDLILKEDAKIILIQFPDGLKQYARAIVDYLKTKTDAEFLIWLGQCFGACDTPVGLDHTKIDLMIQFGHNALMPNYLTKKSGPSL